MSDFKTISEVSQALDLPQHVLRFWEGQFVQIKPTKRKGGRRYYSEKDIELIEKIKNLLYVKGYTIKGAKKALNQHFMPQVTSTDESEMRKKTSPADTRQIDIFEVIGDKPAVTEPAAPPAPAARKAKAGDAEKESLKKILSNLKEMEKALKEGV